MLDEAVDVVGEHGFHLVQERAGEGGTIQPTQYGVFRVVANGDNGRNILGSVYAYAIVPGALREGWVAWSGIEDVFPSLCRAETEVVWSITDDTTCGIMEKA